MKRRLFGLIVCVLLSAGGCTNTQLRISTLNQGSTLADIQYQMVLRNLATFAANPSTIPWHMSITTGTAQVADAANCAFYISHTVLPNCRGQVVGMGPRSLRVADDRAAMVY